MSDIQTFVTDNATSKIKLLPLVDGKLPTDKTITTDMNTQFLSEMHEIKYAPGLIDPACVGPYNVSEFTKALDITSENILRINKIQALENINAHLAFKAREFLIDGINAFMGYFGVPLGSCVQKGVIPPELLTRRTEYLLETTVDNTLLDDINNQDPNMNVISFNIINVSGVEKFDGINFNLLPVGGGTQQTIQLRFGDYTIKNICAFVKKYKNNNAIIPYNLVITDNTASHIRLHTFAKAIYDRIEPGFLSSVVGAGADKLTQDQLLTEIIISIKSFGDSLQVYYTKRLQELYPDMYISSSDKNVGAESLLLDSNFILNGTGIRPHLSFFNDKLNFFGEQSFLNTLKGAIGVPGETEYDTCLTITTNIGLLNEDKLWTSIINSIIQLQPSSFTFEQGAFNSDKALYISSLIPDIVCFKAEGFDNITRLLTELYPIYDTLDRAKASDVEVDIKAATKNLITKLSEIDAFFKKTIDVLKISTNNGIELTNKLGVITDFINVKFTPYMLILSTAKYDVINKQTPTETMLDNVKKSIQKILSEPFIQFANNYMDNKIHDVLNNINAQYENIIRDTITNIKDTVSKFDEVTSKYVPPVKREKEARTVVSSIKNAIEFINPAFFNKQGEKDATLSELELKLENAKVKLTALINNVNPGEKVKPDTLMDKAAAFVGFKKTDATKIANARIAVEKSLKKLEEHKSDLINKSITKAKAIRESMSVEPARNFVKNRLEDISKFFDTLTSSISSTTKGGRKTMKKRNKYKSKRTIKYNKYKKNKNGKRSFKKHIKIKRKNTRR
jgi:hypothetical protein